MEWIFEACMHPITKTQMAAVWLVKVAMTSLVCVWGVLETQQPIPNFILIETSNSPLLRCKSHPI